MSVNNLGSDNTGKKYSRKDFLKLLGLGGAGIALSSSAVYALAQNLSQNNLHGEENHPAENNHVIVDNQNSHDGEYGAETHEAHEHSDKQILLDHAATGLFLGHILPQFMKNNPVGAFKAGAIGIGSWYTLSDETAREHFDHEMMDALQGVGLMVGVLQFTETIQVNYKKVMNDYLFAAQDKVISRILEDNTVNDLLSAMNIRIDKNLEFPLSVRSDQSNTDNNGGSLEYTHIAISLDKFSELLPLLVTNVDHFKNAILRSIAHDDYYRYAYDLLNKNGSVNSSLIEDVETIREDVLLNEKELIKGRIAFLTQFIFLTQVPLFGVGQAGVLKNEIKSISNAVKNLFKSAGYLQTDAVEFAAQVEAKLTSFLFNRFAYASDIGPMTASLQIGSKYQNGLKGLWKLIEGMLPVAIINIKPLFDELDIVFDNVVPRRGSSFSDNLSHLPNNIRDFFFKTFGSIKGTIGSLNASKFTLSGNQAFLNNMVIAKEMEKIDPYMKLPLSYNDSKRILKNIRGFFDEFPKFSVNPVSIDIDGQEFGLYGILFYMERLINSRNFAAYSESHKRKTRERISKILLHTSFDFTRVQKALHFLEHDNGNAKRIAAFLDTYLPSMQYAVVNHDDLFDKVTASRIQEPARQSYDTGLDWSIVYIGDSLYASDKALLATLHKNLSYLSYIKENHVDLYDQSHSAFLANVSKYSLRVTKLLPQMKELFSLEEINNWNLLFNGTDFIISGEDSERNFSDLINKLNIPSHIYDKIKDHPLLQKMSLEDLFHRCEKKIGVNSREVVLMVLLIQSPYVVAVVSTVNHRLDKLPKDMNPLMKKYLIGFVTYFLSMFADNYVGEIIGHQLMMKNFPDMDPFDVLQFVGPLAVLGGSQVITGNSPNAVIGTMQKMYGIAFNTGGKDRDMVDSPEFVKWSKLLFEMLYDVVSVGSLAEDPFSLSGGLSAIAQMYRPTVFNVLNKKI